MFPSCIISLLQDFEADFGRATLNSCHSQESKILAAQAIEKGMKSAAPCAVGKHCPSKNGLLVNDTNSTSQTSKHLPLSLVHTTAQCNQ